GRPRAPPGRRPRPRPSQGSDRLHLLDRREARRLAEDVVATRAHLQEEAAVDPGEAPHAQRAPPVEEREELEALAHERIGARRLLLHERPPAGARAAGGDLLLRDAEAAELVLRDVDASQ